MELHKGILTTGYLKDYCAEINQKYSKDSKIIMETYDGEESVKEYDYAFSVSSGEDGTLFLTNTDLGAQEHDGILTTEYLEKYCDRINSEWGQDSNVVIQIYDTKNVLVCGKYVIGAAIGSEGTLFLSDDVATDTTVWG